MSNPAQFTRAGLFLCGVAGIVLTACIVLPESAERIVRSFFHRQYYTQIPVVLSMLVTPIFAVGISGYLIAKCDAISQKLFPEEEVSPNQIERAIYRVALTAIAVLVFSETLPHFIHAFGMTIVQQFEFGDVIDDEQMFSLWNAPYLISFIFKLLIGFYLLFGAPHLVEWQMARSEPRKKNEADERFRFHLIHLLVLMGVSALALGLIANGVNFRLLPR